MRNLFTCFAFLITSSAFAQNIGINNTAPTEKLDITGNIKADTAKVSSLVVNNGFIKVSGANKSAFTITAVTGAGGNVSGNIVSLAYSSMNATDILIVSHNLSASYIGSIGTWWSGTAWTIFREDSNPIPNGEKFNVMVIRQ